MIYSEFVSAATFAPLNYLPASAWLEHGPFACWLVEAIRPKAFVELGTHNGFSYFTICQIVKELNLGTACYAVDTWQGDEHAGFYTEEVFAKVNEHNNTCYSSFSTLMRMKFDEALSYFPAKSISLLHIDGRHFYEDVVEDYTTWLPKLTDDAIVIFHDTNVRERGFGVWKLFSELKQKHPTFEFVHGHGLGVLAVRTVPPALAPLFAATEEQMDAIRRLYSRLGATVSRRAYLEREAEQRHSEIAHLQRVNEDLNQAIADKDTRIAALNTAGADRDRRLAETAARLHAIETSTSWLAARVAQRAAGWLPRPVRKWIRRLLKAAWWTVSGQLPARLRARRLSHKAQTDFSAEHNRTVREKPEVLLNLSQILAKQAKASVVSIAPKATIIVPVHNGLHHLETLCRSLFDRTPADMEYIFIDDCSPDERIQSFLARSLGDKPNIRLLRNEPNLGFAGSVNRVVALVETDYFVLLNSDVVVHDNWLPRLLAPFQADAKIASATPFSNAAVFFSFPKVGEDYDLGIDGIEPGEIDAAFAKVDGTITPECDIYAGAAFCMAISSACWREIGPLNEETFGHDYSEEADWCLRAAARGWRNVLVPNLFILHMHGGSLSSEAKKLLIGKNLENVHNPWPTLEAMVPEHATAPPLEVYRVLATLLLADTANGCVLLIDYNGESGGAYAYREKTIDTFRREGRHVLLLTYSRGECDWILTMRYLGGHYRVALSNFDEIADLFSVIEINTVIINNLAFCTELAHAIATLSALKEAHNFHMEYKLHDFFSICPSFFLLNGKTSYCGCGMPLSNCALCAPENRYFIAEHRDLPTWRAMWGGFLAHCDTITAFSQSSLDIFEKVYPLRGKTHVIEHEPLETFSVAYVPPPKEAQLVIGFMGIFVEEKGSHYVLELADILKREGQGAKIVVLGPYPGHINHPNLEFTGRYRRADIPVLCNEHRVKVMVFPSPCPETFSYVSQECMMLNIPLVCFDIGAPAERVRKYGYQRGIIVSEFSAQALREGIEQLLKKIDNNRQEMASGESGELLFMR